MTEESENKDLSHEQKMKFIEILGEIDKKKSVEFLKIIKQYYNRQEDNSEDELPYSLQESDGNIIGKIDKFPIDLRWELFNFLDSK